MSKSKKDAAKTGKRREWKPDAEVEVMKAVESKNEAVFTADDKALLAKQESVIASNVGAFLLLGEALSIIKGRDLQKTTDPKLTFDEYCSKKWGFGKAYAYRLISGYECVTHLKGQMAPNGVTLFPTNEAQVRPLTGLSPEKQVQAWSDVLKKANGGSVTAAMVDDVVEGSADNTTKPEAAVDRKVVAAKAEHKKLNTIAKIIEKALKVDPAERSIRELTEILTKIQKLLNGVAS